MDSVEAKKRRRSHSAASGRNRADAIGLEPTSSALYRDGKCEAYLAPDEVGVFEGRGLVTVTAGALSVWGTEIRPGMPPLLLTADLRDGGALRLESIPPIHQGPLVLTKPSSSLGVSFTIVAAPDAHLFPEHVYEVETPEGFRLLPFRVTLGSSDFLSALPQAIIPPQWTEALDAVQHSNAVAYQSLGRLPVIAVCGPKGTGKSNFARLITNQLVQWAGECYYLDTDCGQPEFTRPGLVSLTRVDAPVFGLPLLRQRSPCRAHFIGDTSPESNPVGYLTAVQSLITWFFQQEFSRSAPLILNTNGWIKGLGYDLLCDVLRSLSPTLVVGLMSPNPKNNLPEGHFWGPEGKGGSVDGCSLLNVPGYAVCIGEGTAGTPSRSAPETRASLWLHFARSCVDVDASASSLQLQSQDAGLSLQQTPPARQGGAAASSNKADEESAAEKKWSGVAGRLAAQRPFRVSLREVRVDFIFSGRKNGEAPWHADGSDSTCRALNCALVGLCELPAASASGRGANEDPPVFVGHGLVRTADAATQTLYILTDVPRSELARCRMLRLGKMELPPQLHQSADFASPYVALHSLQGDGTGAVVMRSRNNIARVGLQRGAAGGGGGGGG